ncbi:MAG: long-chain fatty acid transporter [Deltaproteobacteria bacterium]|nr:MAG: long-chain fatty acid transporter [Deltaproteobacteria bacterium]
MKKVILWALVMGFFSNTAFAGCVDTFGIGAKATALGGAYAAYADNVYALYYNPAGLSQIDSAVFSIGVMGLQPDGKITNFTVEGDDAIKGIDFSTDTDSLIVPTLGAAYPVNEKLTLGLAVYVPFGLDVKWKDDPAKNPASYNCFHSWYIREVVTPGLSYTVNDKLAVGLGVSLGKSMAGDELVFDAFGVDLGQIKVDVEDSFNYSFNVGVMYRPLDHLTVGLTYRSRTDTEFDGDLKIKLNDAGRAFLTANPVLGGVFQPVVDNPPDATVEYDHPDQLQAGIRLITKNNISLEFDLVWTNWASVQESQILQLSGESSAVLGALYPGRRIVYARHWNNTKQIRMGAEWSITDVVTLRCGYFYDPTPIPDDTFDFQWPDGDKKIYNIGAGFNLEKWALETVVTYATAESKRIIGGESGNLNHSYDDHHVSLGADGYILGFGVNVAYQF